MARTPILDANRIVIGYIEEQGGGEQKALDRNAMLLGYYDPSTNNTLNANRMLVGKGNQLSSLIEDTVTATLLPRTGSCRWR